MDSGKDTQLLLRTPDTSTPDSDAGQAKQDKTVGKTGPQPGDDTVLEQDPLPSEEEAEQQAEEDQEQLAEEEGQQHTEEKEEQQSEEEGGRQTEEEEERQSEDVEQQDEEEEQVDNLVDEEEILDGTLEAMEQAVIQESGHEVEEEEDEATAAAEEGNAEGAISTSHKEAAATGSSEDHAVSRSSEEGAATRSSEEGAASKSSEERAVSDSHEEGAASKSSEEGAASKSSEEGAASKSSEEGAASKSSEEGAASRSRKEGTANDSHEEGAASRSRKEGTANDSHEEGAVTTPHHEGRTAITNHNKHDDSSHTSNDYDSRTKCPLSKITHKYCAWTGPLKELENHVKTNHAKILKTSPTFECKSVGNKVFLILLNREIFLYYKHTAANGNMYVVVQQVGITDGCQYEARVTLRDDSYQIITIFPIGKTMEYLEDIFDNRKCAFITEERLYDLVKDSEIDMEVTIQELRKRKRTEEDSAAPHS